MDNQGLEQVVAEYLLARNAYEAAIKPRSGFELERRLAYDSPILRRWQAARKALGDAVQVGADDAARAPAVPLSGDDRTLWGVVANAGRLSTKRQQRWAHVMDATGHGSTVATRLCLRFGFDPDEGVGGEPAA